MPQTQSNRFTPSTTSLALLRAATVSVMLAAPAWVAHAAVYRCPGQVLTYTDQLTPAQAKERGCTVVENAPVTIVNGNRARPQANAAGTAASRGGTPSASGAGAASGAAAAPSRGGDAQVSEREQRDRDRDAKRILEDEIARERDKLASMKKDFNNGEPERMGGERNFQKYLDRVEEIRQAIARKEADIAAIERELSKVGGGRGGG
jgi:hypothetical protein